MPISDPALWLDNHGDALYRYALLRLRDPMLAEDMVQETLLAAVEARARYAGDASERTWLIGILKHKIIDQLRKKQRAAPLAEAPAAAALDALFVCAGFWRFVFFVLCVLVWL